MSKLEEINLDMIAIWVITAKNTTCMYRKSNTMKRVG